MSARLIRSLGCLALFCACDTMQPAGLLVGGADSSVLSWGHFGGLPPANIIKSGGAIPILSFLRISKGQYRIVYDISTNDVGVVTPVASGFGFQRAGSGEFVVDVIGVRQDTFAPMLTIEVFAVTTVLDTSSSELNNVDSIFNLVVFGERK